MVLVDYSESEGSNSDSEAPAKRPAPPPPPKAAPAKKPFQKVVDRSNPGKIIVNLPPSSAGSAKAAQDGEPPAKRARTAGGGLFSGFNSSLPPPKNARKAPPPPPPTAGRTQRPGVALKTSAEPGFVRGDDQAQAGHVEPPAEAVNSAPAAQQRPPPPVAVELVGKPTMFRPLSVARSAKAKKKKPVAGSGKGVSTVTTPSSAVDTKHDDTQPSPAPKKMSLFSLHTEEASEPTATAPEASYDYAHILQAGRHPGAVVPDDHHVHQSAPAPAHDDGPAAAAPTPTAGRLDSIADDLQLSAAARRELFGRDGGQQAAAAHVINFNMDDEYQHNETIRAAGEQQVHNPVRAIQGGKHSLRQLVQNVQSQREALEDSFAQGKSNRKEASSRYGWR